MLKDDMMIKRNYYLQIQIVYVMRSKQKIFIMSFGKIKNYLIIVITQKTVNIVSSENKKVIGKFKDEAAGMLIREFTGLRSKMYSYVKDNDKNEKTAKGIRKYVIKKEITHENYKDCLFNRKQLLHKMNTIRSVNHQIGSYKLNKISLSCVDDKRYILDDGCNSLAYGHYKINQ